jgi:uroporphyrinogen III methyltransferase/synthase
MLGEDASHLLSGVTIASLGPLTSATLRSHGLQVTVEAAVPTVEALIEVLQGYFAHTGAGSSL